MGLGETEFRTRYDHLAKRQGERRRKLWDILCDLDAEADRLPYARPVATTGNQADSFADGSHDHHQAPVCRPVPRSPRQDAILFSSRSRSAYHVARRARWRRVHGCLSGGPCWRADAPTTSASWRGGHVRSAPRRLRSKSRLSGLSALSKRPYRLVMERWLRDDSLGHRMVRDLKRAHVEKMLGRRVETPGAANDLLKKIRILMAFAIAHRLRTDHPDAWHQAIFSGRRTPYVDRGGDCSIRSEVAFGYARTRRLRFAALHGTASIRRGGDDVATYHGRTHQRHAGKNEAEHTKTTRIRLHWQLAAALGGMAEAACLDPHNHVRQRVSAGRVRELDGRNRIAAAGLPEHCVTHGLRKAAARRFAEGGCPAHEIMAITGHTSLKEVQRYTAEVDQMQLAESAAIER